MLKASRRIGFLFFFSIMDRQGSVLQQIWISHGGTINRILILHCFFFMASLVVDGSAEMKAESVNPIPTLSPPEGNNTFLQGTSWCVARAGVSTVDLQNALDWACGLGMADCSPLQPGSNCYQPDSLVSHASYAFNSYYQQNGNSPISCNFGGTATITTKNPSYGTCVYPSAGSVASEGTTKFVGNPHGLFIYLFGFHYFLLLLFEVMLI
ncbi:glucan endo-1,3-beta-glucosidase 13-like [Nymphaea colorata]|nr:glucan endo-1,3-beta-glucosidase 13-like [Nymphaea colorata]